MGENLFNSAHKATNQNYRDHYDETFGEVKIGKIIPFGNPFWPRSGKIIFDSKNYGVIAYKSKEVK